MKLYTRRGDHGHTRINGPGDLHKSDDIFEALGTVDELNCFIGLARQTCTDVTLRRDVLPEIQSRLLDIGSALSAPYDPSQDEDGKGRCRLRNFDDVIRGMEAWIDEADTKTPPLSNFILPGGNGESASRFHACRAVARRAERRVAAIAQNGSVEMVTVSFLNRLSDLLFAAARLEVEQPDTVYKKSD